MNEFQYLLNILVKERSTYKTVDCKTMNLCNFHKMYFFRLKILFKEFLYIEVYIYVECLRIKSRLRALLCNLYICFITLKILKSDFVNHIHYTLVHYTQTSQANSITKYFRSIAFSLNAQFASLNI